MSAFSIENTVVRIADRNAEPIERLLREVFPALAVTREPVPEGYAFHVLVSFRPPTDEDISVYDWIHSTGAGIDVIVRRIGEDGGAPGGDTYPRQDGTADGRILPWLCIGAVSENG